MISNTLFYGRRNSFSSSLGPAGPPGIGGVEAESGLSSHFGCVHYMGKETLVKMSSRKCHGRYDYLDKSHFPSKYMQLKMADC